MKSASATTCAIARNSFRQRPAFLKSLSQNSSNTLLPPLYVGGYQDTPTNFTWTISAASLPTVDRFRTGRDNQTEEDNLHLRRSRKRVLGSSASLRAARWVHARTRARPVEVRRFLSCRSMLKAPRATSPLGVGRFKNGAGAEALCGPADPRLALRIQSKQLAQAEICESS
jgi:hypothetical protein